MPPAVPTMPESIPAAAMSIASGAEIMRLVSRDEEISADRDPAEPGSSAGR